MVRRLAEPRVAFLTQPVKRATEDDDVVRITKKLKLQWTPFLRQLRRVREVEQFHSLRAHWDA